MPMRSLAVQSLSLQFWKNCQAELRFGQCQYTSD